MNMNRRSIANIAMIGLVVLEVTMGFASTTPDVPHWVQALLLVAVLAVGSTLQATLMEQSLRHRRHENWRQYPSFALQGALFLMIAYWAHKGLGNTIFTDLNEPALLAAGAGLGLITMFGPEIVNHTYDEPEAPSVPLSQPSNDHSKPVTYQLNGARVSVEPSNRALPQDSEFGGRLLKAYQG